MVGGTREGAGKGEERTFIFPKWATFLHLYKFPPWIFQTFLSLLDFVSITHFLHTEMDFTQHMMGLPFFEEEKRFNVLFSLETAGQVFRI